MTWSFDFTVSFSCRGSVPGPSGLALTEIMIQCATAMSFWPHLWGPKFRWHQQQVKLFQGSILCLRHSETLSALMAELAMRRSGPRMTTRDFNCSPFGLQTMRIEMQDPFQPSGVWKLPMTCKRATRAGQDVSGDCALASKCVYW